MTLSDPLNVIIIANMMMKLKKGDVQYTREIKIKHLNCFDLFCPLQKEWREDRHGAFKRKVARCVRKSQETAVE